MKFKTFYNKESVHKSPVCCIDWSNNEELYSVSDELQIYKWNSITKESFEVAKLPEDFIPTDLHWSIGKTSKNNDSLLISSNDGRFIILNKTARVERNITAHGMAITSGRWSPDGAGLLTASEDGIIKIWSRSGMLRSTVVQSEESIRCARWSPQSSAILFCQSGYLSIKPLAANSRITKWRAHDGLILCLSWSLISNLIASGGEDSRYKIWDTQGTNIYVSPIDNFVITSIEFNPWQDLLAVGGFNTLRLCCSNGSSFSNNQFNSPNVGSLYGLTWSSDGTQICCGSSSGNLIFAYIIEKQCCSRNMKATTSGRKSIMLQDIQSGTVDVLDFPDRIIDFDVGYGHLIVATSNQIHIFNENYINTPIIIDSRLDVKIIQIGKKFFVIVDASSIMIYTYTGRLHLSPRYPGSQVQIINITKKTISIGLDILAVKDTADLAVIHVIDLLPGASRQTESKQIHSKNHISEVTTSRNGTPEDQYVAFIDVNRELYITSVRDGNEILIHKIGTQLISVKWASETNILVGLHDACYSIWYCPGEGSSDPTIIALTTVTFDSMEFGKNITLLSFDDALITFLSSGTIFTININIYCEIMHRLLLDGQWQKALKICRIGQNPILWATLAAIATKKNQLEISEEAYCAALQIDKVNYLQYIKQLPSNAEQMAENSLMLGRSVEAETILLHNKNFKKAIAICIRMHNWKKALEIAEKNDIDMDFVLNERKKYLNALGRPEFDSNFLKIVK